MKLQLDSDSGTIWPKFKIQFSIWLLMTTQRVGSCGQSVHYIVAAAMLITFHLISLFKTGNMMENGNLVVVFHFPYSSHTTDIMV